MTLVTILENDQLVEIQTTGAPGPAGPAGATGATGPQGPTGPAGPAGASTLASLTDVTGTAGTGKAPVSNGAGQFPLTDIATQAELDAEISARATAEALLVPKTRAITAGSGLGGGGALSADVTLDVNVDGATIEVNADTLRVKDAGITSAKLGIGTPTNDDIIQRKAGAWTNRTIAQLLSDLAALGTTFQPLDGDLTSIAALSTQPFGRSLLTAADAAAARTLLGVIASLFQSGGAQQIALDTLAAPTDITTLNASSSAHGLLPKLSDSAVQALNGKGAWAQDFRNGYWPRVVGRILNGDPRTINSAPTLTSGTPRGTPVYLPAGFVVNTLAFSSSATVGSPTHQYFALCDDDSGTFSGNARGVLAVSADDTTAAWAGPGIKALNMTTPYVVPTAGWYYAVILVTATTMPNIAAYGPTNAAAALMRSTVGGNSSSTGLTSIPATGLGAFTLSNNAMAVEVS